MKLSRRERAGASLLGTVVFVGFVVALGTDLLPWFLSHESRPAAMWVAVATGALYHWLNSLRDDAKTEEERQERQREREEKSEQERAQVAREQQKREAKEASERAAADAREEKRLNIFRPYSLSCEVNGEVVHVAWDGPLDDLTEKDPLPMTPALITALFPAISMHPIERLTPHLRRAQGLKEPRIVYATDEKRTEKRRLRSTAAIDSGSVLRVTTDSASGHDYCPRCGLLSNGGNYCGSCPNKEGGAPPSLRGLPRR